MKRGSIVRGAFVAALIVILLAIVAGYRGFQQNFGYDTSIPTAIAPATTVSQPNASLLYGRVTIFGGVTYEGRLRWGGVQEAFWGEYFNGVKAQNPWAVHLPDRLRTQRPTFFGIAIGHAPIDLGRPFMARFGDMVRIERIGRDVRVTLKSGAVFDLDYSELNDFDDGVRVWDSSKGVFDLDHRRVAAIDLLPAPPVGDVMHRLYGTVQTRQGNFTGFVQWNRNASMGTDELAGRPDDGADSVSVRFDTIKSIARQSADSSRVTLIDGREIVLTGTREAGKDNLGLYVDDPRYGRVLISWGAFDRVDFSPAGSGPGYDEFLPGRALIGNVSTRAGRRLAGRLVFDLDESETTETLDAPAQGVNYMIPFSSIASIAVPVGATQATVALHSGEALQLDRRGDLSESNGGMLIFVDGNPRAEYVPWADVERIDFSRSRP
jgi:hypothetical protein